MLRWWLCLACAAHALSPLRTRFDELMEENARCQLEWHEMKERLKDMEADLDEARDELGGGRARLDADFVRSGNGAKE